MKGRRFFAGTPGLLLAMGLLLIGCNQPTDDKADGNAVTVNPGDFITPPGESESFNDITAAQWVSNVRIGWNLGNTLEAYDLTWLPANPTVTQLEKAWNNPATTEANITTLKDAGFNAIRLPVSWLKASDSDYNIRADWMARITAIVDYAVDNDMYVILNTHHDEVSTSFVDLKTNTDLSKSAFRKIWGQIADNFKNYNEKLVFEALNEPRTVGSAAEWSGGTATERSNLNTYYQAFVDVVRASGGNNSRRILMINPYGASGDPAPMNDLAVPNDPALNKIIVSYHCYEPYNFAQNPNSLVNTWSAAKSSDTSAITSQINNAYNKFVSNGIPVVIGEFGAVNKENEDVRALWAAFFVTQARNKGIPCFWWDNGLFSGTGDELFGLLNRNANSFAYSQLLAALLNASR